MRIAASPHFPPVGSVNVMILRPHGEDEKFSAPWQRGAFVGSGQRSRIADGLDPEALRTTNRRKRQPKARAETWDGKKFTETFATAEPQNKAPILAEAAS